MTGSRQVATLFCLVIFSIKNASHYIICSFPCHHYCRNNKVTKTGPRVSPCFTPITHAIVLIIYSAMNFTLNSLCNALNRSTSFFGTPNLVNIIHNSSLGKWSKALTRLRNNTHDSKLCSLHFLMAVFLVKIASMQPLPWQNLHCGSWSRLSSIGRSLECKIIAMILYAISKIMIPW